MWTGLKTGLFFKIKAGLKLELLTPETMKLLESTKKDADKELDKENVPKLESVEIGICWSCFSSL